MSVSEDAAGLDARRHSEEASGATHYEWSLAQRITFRFACSFIVIYNFPDPLSSIPWIARVLGWYETLSSKIMFALVPWVGKHLLHVMTPASATFSDDGIGYERFAYLQLFCDIVFAIIATLVWTLLDRRRKEYTRLYDWLRIYVRYILGASMVMYGVAKVLKAQMGFPSLDELLQPFGNSSPMGLLWKFMGYSTVYEFFAGAAELLGGILVFFRRTTTLGALIITAVMINVTIMNFCYDVPVKFNASRLLFLAAFLLLPDLRGLVDFFVLKRTAAPSKIGQTFTAKWMRIVGWAVKALFIGYVLFTSTKQFIGVGRKRAAYERRLDGKINSQFPFFGIYEVEAFTKNGQVVPPLTTDANRWDKLIFYGGSSMKVRTMTDSDVYAGKFYSAHVDTAKNTITLSPEKEEEAKDKSVTVSSDQDDKYIFTYTKPDASHLVLQGTLKNDSFVIKTKRIDTDMPLVARRGFHWITDHPLNR
jgi:uncharacterized membrane protein YphA (DoxX/SURF4 family)